MSPEPQVHTLEDAEYSEPCDQVAHDIGLSRRGFVQALGAGLLVTVSAPTAMAAGRRRRRRRGATTVAARLHIARDGKITVLTGKVEMGQGARAELAQAAAEELRVPVGQIEMLMGDTSVVPNDGITAGSRTTPSSVPAVRRGAAAARSLLVQLACQRWKVKQDGIEVRDGTISHSATNRALRYTDLARTEDLAEVLKKAIPSDITLTPVKRWTVLGKSVPRPNRRGFVTGEHKFPSDLVRPGMLRGKILRPPSYGAKLVSVDLDPANAMSGVVAVRDGQFVGVAAPTAHRARQAIEAIGRTAKWEAVPHPSSDDLSNYLRRKAGGASKNPFADEVSKADKALRQTYHVAYVQHAPLETRTALAEWSDGSLTVWAGTQNPFGYHRELARAFRLPGERVRVVVPDFGSGFGGKHTAEPGVEAARLARAAKRPVLLHWTREEEFTWAYFRPAAVIDAEASLDSEGRLTSWHFVNINSGRSAVRTPYRAGKTDCRFARSDPRLRQGSYRALAATANNFARECFMDELAAAAEADPLDFRLAHLDNARLHAVLEEAARRFGWRKRVKQKQADVGVGLACGTEKGSYVAACAEVAIDREAGRIDVRRVCQVFECGGVVNPDNLLSQVQGCILMGLGPALREAMRFEGGRIQNPSFSEYRVPRLSDMPELDIHLLNRPDLPSVGGGETPIIAVAPAVGNAVFHATGVPARTMPIRVPPPKRG